MNPYVDLCLSIQALRRDVERVRTPLAPALGASASVYTHQLSNTLRVLTDIRVRHLLADEVGLGKTVQALMIMNALKIQRPNLRVLIVVPDRLVPQWRDEILTRAHTAPRGEAEAGESNEFVRLAWEDQLKTGQLQLSDIDADQYDLLIVDELHKLTTALQDRIVRESPGFEHLLVLTATPAFQQVKRHSGLFALLEPERTAIAQWRWFSRSEASEATRSDENSEWTEAMAEHIVRSIVERDRAASSTCPPEHLEVVALSDCAYRRVIRTRRLDFPGTLPKRRHNAVKVDPLGAEVQRQALMWRYFERLNEIGYRVDPVLLARRVVLSPPSLEQRVDFFRRKGHDRDGLLEAVKPLVHRSNGDSRADALIDLLRSIWEADPTERVLVAAQDNLTVDYLFDLTLARLPTVGPFDERSPLVAARIRQGMTTDAVDDIAGFGNETSENLEMFQRGDARVLFAPEAAQVGLNLQCARVVILYSVPWKPEEVEQWIGRLDRIGNISAFAGDGMAQSIDVYTIVQKGLVDDKVVTVLEKFSVFERGVNLDGDHLEEVSSLIEAAALRPQEVDWADLQARSESMAREDAVQELDSSLRSNLPWSAASAIALKKKIDATPPVAPTLLSSSDVVGGPRGWDQAFEAMIRLLRRCGEYTIRTNDDPSGQRFQSLWYRFGEAGIYGSRTVVSRVIFSCGADPSHERQPRNAHAFITRRADLSIPPRRSVNLQLEGTSYRRPLRFLNFGDQIHDELVAGWLPSQQRPEPFLDVPLFSKHEFFATCEPAVYIVRFARLSPLECLPIRHLADSGRDAIIAVATGFEPEHLVRLGIQFGKRLVCALEADSRWLSSLLPADLRVSGLRKSNETWIPVNELDLALLLNPLAHDRPGVPPSANWSPSPEERKAVSLAVSQLRASDEAATRILWGQHHETFERALAARRKVVAVEAADAVEQRECEVKDAKSKVELSLIRGNLAQISRAEKELSTASSLVIMERKLWEVRDAWLAAATNVFELRPKEEIVSALRVRRGL